MRTATLFDNSEHFVVPSLSTNEVTVLSQLDEIETGGFKLDGFHGNSRGRTEVLPRLA